jgi:hypothetical protein
MVRLRRVFASFAIIAAGYLIGAIMISPASTAWLWRTTVSQTPTPSTLPCKKQQWPNADRVCLTWTAPRKTDGRADGRRP